MLCFGYCPNQYHHTLMPQSMHVCTREECLDQSARNTLRTTAGIINVHSDRVARIALNWPHHEASASGVDVRATTARLRLPCMRGRLVQLMSIVCTGVILFRVTGQRMDEKNPPMALPNGQVHILWNPLLSCHCRLLTGQKTNTACSSTHHVHGAREP